MFEVNRYREAIEEIVMDGSVSLGRCSKSTAYRWAKEINEILEHEKYPWRVSVVNDDIFWDLIPRMIIKEGQK